MRIDEHGDKPKPRSESEFQAWVLDTARALGWRCFHFHDSRRQVAPGVHVGDKDAAGFCDLVMLHDDPPRLIFAEVKGPKGKLSEAQREFLQAAKLVANASIEDGLSEVASGTRTVGVFLFEPGQEELIEGMLRTRRVA